MYRETISFRRINDARLAYDCLKDWDHDHQKEYCGSPLNYVSLKRNSITVTDRNVLSILEDIVKNMNLEKSNSKNKESKKNKVKEVVAKIFPLFTV